MTDLEAKQFAISKFSAEKLQFMVFGLRSLNTNPKPHWLKLSTHLTLDYAKEWGVDRRFNSGLYQEVIIVDTSIRMVIYDCSTRVPCVRKLPPRLAKRDMYHKPSSCTVELYD